MQTLNVSWAVLISGIQSVSDRHHSNDSSLSSFYSGAEWKLWCGLITNAISLPLIEFSCVTAAGRKKDVTATDNLITLALTKEVTVPKTQQILELKPTHGSFVVRAI